MATNKDDHLAEQEYDHAEARTWRIALRAATLMVVQGLPEHRAIEQAQGTQLVADEAQHDPHGVLWTLAELQEAVDASPAEQAQIEAVAKDLFERIS